MNHLNLQSLNEHVQLGGSRKSSMRSESSHNHHHHHENHDDIPSRPLSVASSARTPNHCRSSSVSTIRTSAPIQRVAPTIQSPYGDHQSIRVVKNVRKFVTVFGSTHNVPPPTPLAGVPRLSHDARAPISPQVFQSDILEKDVKNYIDHHETRRSTASSRKSSCCLVEHGIKSNKGSRKSSNASNILIGGNIKNRSRQSTITKDNISSHIHKEHDAEEDKHDIICVSRVRQIFEKMGPSHLPEYAMSPQSLIH